MKVPDKFPPGCEFWASESGDEFVRFPPPGGLMFLSDDGESLKPAGGLPRNSAPMTESAFLNCANDCKEFMAWKLAS